MEKHGAPAAARAGWAAGRQRRAGGTRRGAGAGVGHGRGGQPAQPATARLLPRGVRQPDPLQHVGDASGRFVRIPHRAVGREPRAGRAGGGRSAEQPEALRRAAGQGRGNGERPGAGLAQGRYPGRTVQGDQRHRRPHQRHCQPDQPPGA